MNVKKQLLLSLATTLATIRLADTVEIKRAKMWGDEGWWVKFTYGLGEQEFYLGKNLADAIIKITDIIRYDAEERHIDIKI